MTNDKILSTNSIAPSPFIVGKNLHGHHLELLACHGDLLLVLVVTFQLRLEAEPVHFLIKYLHKRFDRGFIKNDIISTKQYHTTKC
jgi:hypothetical protein